MHACGHDVHITTMIGTARALAATRSKWHGMLMLIGQPSEETIDGHGALPQVAKDPIVMAGEFIVQLQTVVSRQENPRDPTVVTIGDIHGGTKRNIIPNEVKLELTARPIAGRAECVR